MKYDVFYDGTIKTSKYVGLLKIADREEFEKRAILNYWERFTERHPFLSTALYFIPGLGSAAIATDALNDFRRGRWLSGLLGLGSSALNLFIPGAGVLGKGLSATSRFGRFIPRAAQLARKGYLAVNLAPLVASFNSGKFQPESFNPPASLGSIYASMPWEERMKYLNSIRSGFNT